MDTSSTTRSMTATPVQTAATVVAAVFLIVGIAGFIPGITTHYGDLSFAGHHSQAKLLGLFEVSVLHNIVHLLFGVVGLAMARSWTGARSYLIGGGIVYFVLFLYGSSSTATAARTSCRSTAPTTGFTSCWRSAWSCSAWR